MEAVEILSQAKESAGRPSGWVVFPLLRHKVLIGIVGWLFGIVMGLGLLVVIVPVVIPYNYQRGALSSIVTTILLGILIFVTGGSLSLLIADILRLRQADRHLIVITPEDFVKQAGDKITHVPLASVRHVTARGKAPVDRTPPATREEGMRDIPGVGENMMSFILGRRAMPSETKLRRKRMRTPTSLAFIDARTDSEVTVVDDEAFGDPYLIAAVLKQYAASQEIVM
ncbi:MAG TPA: hypothetical protein VFB12_15595 [Ktedonobacteraceae bacterium]|nr:hypothetical protein [Ktedonobacteraceae bacterium]